MRLPNEDIRHRRLPRNLPQRILQRRPILDLIELNGEKLGALLREELLGRAAVGAVGFGEDGDGVVVDDALCFCACRGHGSRGGAAGEELAEEGNCCGLNESSAGELFWGKFS